MKKASEKRGHLRADIYHLIKYKPVSGEKTTVLASLKNISGGGICLVAEEEIPVSTVLQIYINFPHLPQPIPAVAKIVWLKKVGKGNRFHAGLQFLEIDEVLRQGIVRRVETVYKKQRT